MRGIITLVKKKSRGRRKKRKCFCHLLKIMFFIRPNQELPFLFFPPDLLPPESFLQQQFRIPKLQACNSGFVDLSAQRHKCYQGAPGAKSKRRKQKILTKSDWHPNPVPEWLRDLMSITDPFSSIMSLAHVFNEYSARISWV